MKYHGTGEWTDDQLLASYALCIVQKGYHHMGKIKADGRTGVVTSIHGDASTFDYDALTRIVLVAHQMGVRISVGSSGPRMIKLRAHARYTSDDKNGELCICHRHPSLDFLASECKRWELPPVIKYTEEDYLVARRRGEYDKAAEIARCLLYREDGSEDPRWVGVEQRMKDLGSNGGNDD